MSLQLDTKSLVEEKITQRFFFFHFTYSKIMKQWKYFIGQMAAEVKSETHTG